MPDAVESLVGLLPTIVAAGIVTEFARRTMPSMYAPFPKKKVMKRQKSKYKVPGYKGKMTSLPSVPSRSTVFGKPKMGRF